MTPVFLAAASLFFTEPVPLDMPRAEAYLVRERGVLRLEDRFNRSDLWLSQTVIGRWVDDEGRVFLLSRLDAESPRIDRDGTLTRADAEARRTPMKRLRANREIPAAFRSALAALAPCPLAEEPRATRQLPHGYRRVDYWQSPTNYTDIVCVFRPETSETCFVASWQLVEGDDYPARMEAFEEDFLRREFPAFLAARGEAVLTPPPRHSPQRAPTPSERELLRRDARHSVAAYDAWHVTDAEEFTVLDDLPSRGFVETLTNDFARMRRRYAAVLPTPLDGANALCVARLFATRDEYMDALEADGLTNLAWSAAYWSPARRELVAHLAAGGETELLKTIRHEAFHQYLSYATSMIAASPWLNEGYAQYFEDETSEDWGPGLEIADDVLERLSAAIPALLFMDYEQFYAGTDAERRAKYRLAWSVVRFLELGADKVRLDPFRGLKARYLDALLQTHDMRRATGEAFRDPELLAQFVAEWLKFWRRD